MENIFINKEDYEESCCGITFKNGVMPIPTDRVIDTLDGFLNKKDYPSAEKHLKFWLNEAKSGNDKRGMLTVINEQIGLYRKTAKEKEGLVAIGEALELLRTAELENTVTGGTTLLNAATAYKAFGKAESALELYKKAKEIYESTLEKNDSRLAGLYNNMAITLTGLGNYKEAEELYNKALEIMSVQKNGEADMAVTYLNIADLIALKSGQLEGAEKIENCLNKAECLLNSDNIPKDGYYAFVCEKCAPVFGYYGYFLTEKELKNRAEEIYERN